MKVDNRIKMDYMKKKVLIQINNKIYNDKKIVIIKINKCKIHHK